MWKPHTSVAVVAGAERVLELVAVAPLLDRRNDLLHLEAVKAPEPAQRVLDLLRLDGELALVGQDLPRRPGMVGDGCYAVRTRLDDLDRACLGVVALALGHDRSHAIAGKRVTHEHDVGALAERQTGDPVATECE